MNIIKLKDIIKENDSFFNENLKGRYAWWVHMRYIIPFKDMSVQQYVSVEEDATELMSYDYIDSYDAEYSPYIDIEETDKCNSISPYILHNCSVVGPDLTTADLKGFRTWLAHTILKMDSISPIMDPTCKVIYNNLDDKTTHMLKYYARGGTDEIIEGLNKFVNSSIYMIPQTDQCSCTMRSGYTEEIANCDPVSIYIKGIYNNMVENFSDMEFWLQFKNQKWFFELFKLYIDEIIKKDFTLSQENIDTYTCVCQYEDKQEINKNKLMNLSKSLEYIIKDDYNGHKNFINDSLTDWAKDLYEIMIW